MSGFSSATRTREGLHHMPTTWNEEGRRRGPREGPRPERLGLAAGSRLARPDGVDARGLGPIALRPPLSRGLPFHPRPVGEKIESNFTFDGRTVAPRNRVATRSAEFAKVRKPR